MVDKQKDPSRLAKLLGKRIAQRRKELQWTQEQLAERVGVDAETISRFERGVNLPSLPTLDGLAEALNVEVGDLLARPTPASSDDASLIATWLQGVSTKDRSFVLKLVRDCCTHLRQKST